MEIELLNPDGILFMKCLMQGLFSLHLKTSSPTFSQNANQWTIDKPNANTHERFR